MITICIDTGNSCGIAAFDNTELITSQTRPWDLTEILKFIRIVSGCGKDVRCICELPWFGVNPKASIGLARKVGQIEAMCEFEGYEFADVYPTTWQSYCFGSKLNRKDGKKMACKIASIYANKLVSADAADAVCIGLWATGAKFTASQKEGMK